MRKRALITGASEGIGRAFAHKLAQQGFEIIGVARNEERLQDLMTELGNGELGNAGHSYVVADLTVDSDVQKIAGRLRAERFDLLVNNAGFGKFGKFEQLDPLELQKMIRLNCEALMMLAHAYLQGARSGDALINVSSALAFLPLPEGAVYSGTKAFVTSFSEALWFEQKERGVYVLGLCPGVTDTTFHVRAGGKSGDLPRSMTETADQVVETALKALRSRARPTVVSGRKNRLATIVTRAFPRKAVVSLMGKGN